MWLLMPLLQRYALAKSNARSSHIIPTPQGGGIAVIAATLMVSIAFLAPSGSIESRIPTTVVLATLFMAALGAADDIKSISVLPRLIGQGLAVGSIVLIVPAELRIIPACPFWIERGVLLLAGVWFVNLVNFMDGIDWMTVAESVPITIALVIFGYTGVLSIGATMVAATLGGALLGFAPFNRPVAKVFLGDAGSLPIGLILGWCLLMLVYQGHMVAALLLPLYYLADATLTMLHRLFAGEKVWTAHRSHFYQRATNNGFSVLNVVGTVFCLNLALVVLAITSTLVISPAAKIMALVVGAMLVGLALFTFSRPRPTQ
ncbi:glycosyl transferase, family 4 [Nitrobacter sp. Nb-311A]|uniref:MraY family glycosyltransferase n=1 Tax=Nitrobacter sp. Nb-311A TaxID=314253 RepID=UPI0000687A25|nr:glycosyltransferase family 4 protein [Nitrobacter sp. Nb-311A]EAQ36415.1 glycosyl transferase, family 4 [Nitrobacter sp. Nb-311A]